MSAQGRIHIEFRPACLGLWGVILKTSTSRFHSLWTICYNAVVTVVVIFFFNVCCFFFFPYPVRTSPVKFVCCLSPFCCVPISGVWLRLLRGFLDNEKLLLGSTSAAFSLGWQSPLLSASPYRASAAPSWSSWWSSWTCWTCSSLWIFFFVLGIQKWS